MTTTNRYDYLNRLTGVSFVPSADSAVSFDYTYNDANQRVAVTNADNSRWSWGYDSLGQVTSGKKYWSDSTVVAGQQFEYAFDSIGNRTSASSGGSQFGTSLRTATYAANLLNQYTNRTVPGYIEVQGGANSSATVTVNNESTYRKGAYYRKELSVANSSAAIWQGITNIAVLNNGGTNGEDIVTTKTGNFLVPKTPEAFTYDADGNLTQDGKWTYTWDAENRLVSKTSLTNLPSASRVKLDFAYDNKWRRIQKIVSTWDGSAYVPQSTNRFLYDGWNLVAMLDGGGNLLQSLRWGTDLSGSEQGAGGVGGLKAMTVHAGTNAGTYFYAYDGNGNVAALLNADISKLAATYEYGPFGELLRASGPLASMNTFRFSTKFCDEESGFYYYGYRYYDPGTGRWLSRDPIREEGGANVYGMVNNQAVFRIDVLGLADAVKPGSRPFDGKHPNLDGCSEGKCCEENLSRLFQYSTAALFRRSVDFTDYWKNIALASGDPTSWNNHRKMLLDHLKAAKNCVKVLSKQIAEGQCTPPPPNLNDVYDFAPKLDAVTDPGEIIPAVVASPGVGTGLIIVGTGIIIGTIIEDVLTGGAGIADDPATIGIGMGVIKAACRCFKSQPAKLVPLPLVP